MALFNFGKKKEEKKACDCGGCCSNVDYKEAVANTNSSEGEYVKVLGSGCAKCNELERATVEALKELGMDTTVEHVTDFAKIAAFGVMTTPALVVGGKVVSYGKVLKTNEVVEMLKKL